MNRSAAGGGIRMMTWASSPGSLDRSGSIVTTAPPSRPRPLGGHAQGPADWLPPGGRFTPPG